MQVRVRWGKPIDVEKFVEEGHAKQEDDKSGLVSKEAVKALSSEIEKRMLQLTINAPDW